MSYVGHLLNPCWIILINLRFYICPGDMFIFGNVHLGVCALFLLKLFFFHFGKINSLGVNMLASTRANLDYFIPAHNLRLVPGTWFFWGKARFAFMVSFIVIASYKQKCFVKYVGYHPDPCFFVCFFRQPLNFRSVPGTSFLWNCVYFLYRVLCIISSQTFFFNFGKEN